MSVAALRSALACGLLSAHSFAADSGFVGTWVERVESYRSSPVNSRSLRVEGQKLHQSTVLGPPRTDIADGVPRPMASGSIEIATLEGNTVFRRRIERNGKPVSEARWEVSPDNRTLTTTTTYYNLTGEQTSRGIFDRKSGTTGLDGTWEPRSTKERSKPETVVIGLSEEGLVITRGWGRSWILDGRPRKSVDGNSATVTARLIGPRSIERVTVSGDKITFRTVMELSADGKTFTQTDRFPSSNGKEITTVTDYEKQ